MAVGTPLTKKYSRLGGSVGRGILSPTRITAFLMGLPGEGKSYLIQSCPDMFIHNMDCSSTTTKTPQAQLFPEIQDDRIVVSPGSREVYAYEHVRAQNKILLDLSKENDPHRPAAVGFDSLSAWIRMLMHWCVRNAQTLGLSKDPVDNWRQLNGMSAWDLIYNEIVDTIVDLRNAGYGVYVIGHIVNATIPIGENMFVSKPELTITDNFWKRLYSVFELSALVCRSETDVTTEKEQIITVRGQEIKKTRHEVTREQVYTLTVNKAELAGLTKSRILKQPIILPKVGTWEAFETAYRNAAE